MKTIKKFVRFIVNTKNHERGEKVKAVSIIRKEFEKDERTGEETFVRTIKPCINAGENQIAVDIEGSDYKEFLPLHHFKYDEKKKEIVKKTEKEIKELEERMKAKHEERLAEQKAKEKELEKAREVMLDENKTLSQRLNAAVKIIEAKK